MSNRLKNILWGTFGLLIAVYCGYIVFYGDASTTKTVLFAIVGVINIFSGISNYIDAIKNKPSND